MLTTKKVTLMSQLGYLQGHGYLHTRELLCPDPMLSGTDALVPTQTSELRYEICFNIGIFGQKYLYEISWEVGSCSSSRIYISNYIYYEECCLESGNYTVKCWDSYGDGWRRWSLMVINGRYYCWDFKDGFSHVDPEYLTVSEPKSFEYCYDISIRTGLNAHEIMWFVMNDRCVSAQRYSDNSMYTEECCLDDMGDQVMCLDAGHNGWHNVTLSINGIDYCSDFQDGVARTEDIKAPTTNPTPTPTPPPTHLPTVNPSDVPTSNPTPTPTLPPTHLPTVNPSDVPTSNPTLVPTHTSELRNEICFNIAI